MKILLTVHQFFPNHGAGTELVAYKVAKMLQMRGHEVLVLTGHPGNRNTPDGERFDRYEYDGIPIRRFYHAHAPMFGQTDLVRNEYHNPGLIPFFNELLDEFRPDVVHFFHLMRLTTSLVDAARARNIPTFYTITDFWPCCPLYRLRLEDGSICAGPTRQAANCLKHLAQVTGGGGHKALRLPTGLLDVAIPIAARLPILKKKQKVRMAQSLSRRLPHMQEAFGRINLLLVLTRTMKSVLMDNGFTADNIRILPHGIDSSHIMRMAPETKGTGAALRVAFMGTITEHKGCHVLIDAIKKLPADAAVQVEFHGNPAEFPAYAAGLRQQVGTDPRVAFAGPYKNHDVSRVLANTDVLVVPSLWYENTPLVIYEAQAAGVPVIASNLGGMAEMVTDQKDGRLFSVGDSGALSQILHELDNDRQKLRALAAHCATPKSTATYVTELESLYAAVLPVGGLPPVASEHHKPA